MSSDQKEEVKPLVISPEVKQELKERPIRSEYTKFTEEQFALRLQHAKDICEWFTNVDATMTTEMKAIYQKYPMWCFYTDKENKVTKKRSFGVSISPSRGEILDTVCAMMLFDNITVGGTEASTLEKVDRWTKDQISHLQMCANPGHFIDPLGFLPVVMEQSRRQNGK